MSALRRRAHGIYDVLIRSGQVVDGTGVAARTADFAIKDERLAEVAALTGKAKQTVKSDVNVTDHARLSVRPPIAHDELPAGSTRLPQLGSGY